MQTVCCNTSVCLTYLALDLATPLCICGTMWMQARGGRQSKRADGYFNRAHGEVCNYHQVLGCVTERVNECLDNTAETPQPPSSPSSIPVCRTTGQSAIPRGLRHSTL